MKNKKPKTKEENEEKILPLSEAAKMAGYTPEYLNLLARQGKLKAQKIGRNWFTNKEWLDELLIILFREREGVVIPEETPEENKNLESEMEIQKPEPVFLSENIEEIIQTKRKNNFSQVFTTSVLAVVILPIIFLLTYFVRGYKNYSVYQTYYYSQPEMKVLNETTRMPRVAGEETSSKEKNVALASENYKINDINVGGSVMIINSEENAELEISNIKSESFIANKKDEVKLIISWQTNKLAISQLNYSKNGGQNSQTLKEDSYGYAHSVVISGLAPRTSYVYQIKSIDHWSNSTKSDYFGVYTSAKPVSVFDLISNATGEVFGWAIKK
jgi:hypothetical protein